MTYQDLNHIEKLTMIAELNHCITNDSDCFVIAASLIEMAKKKGVLNNIKMFPQQIEYNYAESKFKLNGIDLRVVDSDQVEDTIFVPSEDILDIYGMRHVSWFTEFGGNQKVLIELYKTCKIC
jgi:hypothetical protein